MCKSPIIQAAGQSLNSPNHAPVTVIFDGQSIASRAVYVTRSPTANPTTTTQIANRISGTMMAAATLSHSFQLLNLRDEAPTAPTDPADALILATATGNHFSLGLVIGNMVAKDGRAMDGGAAGLNTNEYLPYNYARQPKLIIISAGESDVPAGKATTLTRYQVKIDGYLANTLADILVLTAYTRSLSAYARGTTNDAYRLTTAQLPADLRALYASEPRVTVVDPNEFLTSGLLDGTLAGIPKAFCMLDGIHPTARGAHLVAKYTILPALRRMGYGSALNALYPRKPDYDATDAPSGNAFTNALFTGTGGSHAGVYSTGTLPDKVRSTRVSGDATVATSVVTGSDGNNELLLTFTVGTTYSEFEVLLGSSTNGNTEISNPYAVDDILQGYVKFTLSAYDDWRKANMMLRPSVDAYVVEGGNLETYSGSYNLESHESYAGSLANDIRSKACFMTDEAWSEYIHTPPYKLLNASGDLRVRLKIAFGPGQAALRTGETITARISNPVLSKIVNPILQYNWT
jgi:hypothetical protein